MAPTQSFKPSDGPTEKQARLQEMKNKTASPDENLRIHTAQKERGWLLCLTARAGNLKITTSIAT